MCPARVWLTSGGGGGQSRVLSISTKLLLGKVTLTLVPEVVNVAVPGVDVLLSTGVAAGIDTVPLSDPETQLAVTAKLLPLVRTQVTPPVVAVAVRQVPVRAGWQPVCAGFVWPMPLLLSHS